MKTNKQLQQDVLDELKWDPSVDASKIGVTAQEGVVTLSGQVSNYGQKNLAEKVAKRVLGVKGIANEIDVDILGVTEKTDADIAAAALNALKWDYAVPDEKIKVVVSNGWLTLEGQVNWHYQRDAAYDCVKNLSGVRGVINSILVKPQVKVSEVKAKIKAALHRSAEIDANKIDVDSVDEKVILHGTVRSWIEKEEAEKAAWMAPGVAKVQNDITIGM